MKNLMKISTAILICLLCLQSYGQTYGLKAGLSLGNMLVKDNTETSYDLKMNPGFHLGAIMENSLSNYLSIETGLLFTTKGMKLDEEIFGLHMSAKTNLYYLDVPVTLKASYDLGKGKIYAAVGPYVGVGINGKVKMNLEYEGEKESEEEDIKWGNNEDEDDFKRLDMGLTFGGGIEINAIQIGVSYDLGIANISAYTGEGAKVKNRVLKFSLGYRFLE